MYYNFTESLRTEIQENALTKKEVTIARCLRADHVDISTHIYADAEIGDVHIHPIFEYEMHMMSRTWRPQGNQRLDEHQILENFQIESILSRMQEDTRIILADMLITMGIQDISIMCSTRDDLLVNEAQEDPFTLAAEWDESLPAQLYQLHTNIRAGTLIKK